MTEFEKKMGMRENGAFLHITGDLSFTLVVRNRMGKRMIPLNIYSLYSSNRIPFGST